MTYNLTDIQKDLLRSFVSAIRKNEIPEEFYIVWGVDGAFLHHKGSEGFKALNGVTKAKIEALQKHDLLLVRPNKTGSHDSVWNVSITALGYAAYDSDFKETEPDKDLGISEHTLLAYWKRGTVQDRLGMISFISFIFLIGYLTAKASFFSRAIDLVREVLP